VTIPVTLITGFLGSGKTTLLNQLLKDPGMADTAVIINEFGDVAIDHLLVESAIENAVVLQSGCICCSVRGDLIDTLTDLHAKAERGELPPFSRIAIETTGLADPTSLLRLFAAEPALADQFRLRAVVVTIDAVNGAHELERHEEARRQAALADVLLLTKTDIADPAAVLTLRDQLSRFNPGAEIVPVEHGQITPSDLFGRIPHFDGGSETEAIRWLRLDAFGADEPHADDHGPHHHHDASIRSFALVHDVPIEADALRVWLKAILSLRGQDFLRMKGIVNVRGRPGPVIIHGVQQVLHPATTLAAWPSADRSTRIVFITNGIPREDLQGSLAVLTTNPAAPVY
jgi:G3E family GTPase